MPIYDRFIFESYEFNHADRTIQLRYSLDEKIRFQEIFTLPPGTKLNIDHPDLDAALFALHLSGGASYYKTYCPPTIEVRSGQLNQDQAAFWNKLYTHGLGQFFYENQLDFHGLINFPGTNGDTPKPAAPGHPKTLHKALVPFGGGKDSIVTTELLRTAGVGQTLFRLRGHHLITELAGIAGLPLLEVSRTLDPQVMELNQAGAYNGHIPITAHISMLTVVVGLLAGFDTVFFSSERSSSYGNVTYLGMEVNHQWSKSQEAEAMLAGYIRDYITHDFQYLNLERPLSELHIAKLFAQYPRYFAATTSCNRNWVLTERTADAPRWCGACPKCAFSFALLAAFLPSETVVDDIFGQNLFDKPELLPLYRQLLGIEDFKPFECVGTPEEIQAALYLAMDKPRFAGTLLIREFKATLLPKLNHPSQLVKELLTPELTRASPAIIDILKKAHVL